jgi:hypothetical protein
MHARTTSDAVAAGDVLMSDGCSQGNRKGRTGQDLGQQAPKQAPPPFDPPPVGSHAYSCAPLLLLSQLRSARSLLAPTQTPLACPVRSSSLSPVSF